MLQTKLGGYLTALYQVCRDPNEINFDDLPSRFVMKTTSGGSGDNVMIVRDKESVDKKLIVKLFNQWLKKDYSDTSREWAYTMAAHNPRIIVEEFLENDSNEGLDDYKFLCFNGKFRFLWVDKGRFSIHKRGYWDENLRFLKGYKSEFDPFEDAPELVSHLFHILTIRE